MTTTRRKLYPERDLFYRSTKTTVYLVHFDRKVGHAQHYIGSTNDLSRRLLEHQRKWPRYCLTAKALSTYLPRWNALLAIQDRVFRRKHTFLAAATRCLEYDLSNEEKMILLSLARKHKANGLVMTANQRRIPWRLAATWQANREFEMMLKRGKHAQRLCPICCGEGEDALPDYIPF